MNRSSEPDVWLLRPVKRAGSSRRPTSSRLTIPNRGGSSSATFGVGDVVADLRSTIRRSGLRIDWYGNAGSPLIDLDPADLAADGIALHPNLADEPLVRELRSCDYAIMPSRALSEGHPQDFLYRASLPSRLVYLFTTAHLPVIVLGGTDTAAAQFITGFGLGAGLRLRHQAICRRSWDGHNRAGARRDPGPRRQAQTPVSQRNQSRTGSGARLPPAVRSTSATSGSSRARSATVDGRI